MAEDKKKEKVESKHPKEDVPKKEKEIKEVKDKDNKAVKTTEEVKEKKPSKKHAEKKHAEKKEIPKSKGKTEGENFKYIIRIHEKDINGERPLLYAIHDIPGIGLRVANAVVKHLKLQPNIKIGLMSDKEIEDIIYAVDNISTYLPPWLLNRQYDPETGESYQIVGQDIRIKRMNDINMMRMIKCYRGIRHEKGYKVRGQRTKSNGRTGMAAGVSKKTVQAAESKAAAESKGASDNKAENKAAKK
ncbi:MAG: 30S ribosomal protein S13 [Candidatus Thermoplasmatota archaeon]|nr:30S ribosomal protein S13 [Candidatus Thermoplasmatota archaeon]MCL5963768.1 30S ribosomal protein S13 [Candidatus Thermoplasmatota archaeon]